MHRRTKQSFGKVDRYAVHLLKGDALAVFALEMVEQGDVRAQITVVGG
jgi:hypothetical protein